MTQTDKNSVGTSPDAHPGLGQLLARLAMPVLSLPRAVKRLVALAVDALMCVLTVVLAFYLRLGEWWGLSTPVAVAAGVAVATALPIFVVSGLYRAIFRYSGWPALVAVGRAIGLYGLIFALIFAGIGIPGVPRTIGIIQPMLLLFFVGASRALARLWLGDHYLSLLREASRPKVLIYGAGASGRQLAAAMVSCHDMQVAGFLDDDVLLQGRVLNGLSVYGPAGLDSLAPLLNISGVLLAMPRITRHRRNEILNRIRSAHLSVRTLPSMSDLAQGRVSVSDLREPDIDDLLGRDTVEPDAVLLAMNVRDKVVMVTGAGGSIGSELCRQILAVGPRRLLLVEQGEFALYAIHQELEMRQPGAVIPLLASVQDEPRMREICLAWQPDTVYHAAAYKHVPLVEHNPAQGLRNNVLGTLCAARAALASGVKSFVLISTDKAVRPTNIMGASKRLAEMVLQALAREGGDTCFSMVRFGNVLGSSGSVVPKFRQQIREGGPITLTHPDITRYFMTIPEAAQLVIQAGAMASGGDVFVLDMGQAVRIADLARRMVELSGLTVKDDETPDGDIAIEVTGLRPGEKLFEELLIGDDPQPTTHPRIMKAHEASLPWGELLTQLDSLWAQLDAHRMDQARGCLAALVPGYTPAPDIVDWVYLAQSPGSAH